MSCLHLRGGSVTERSPGSWHQRSWHCDRTASRPPRRAVDAAQSTSARPLPSAEWLRGRVRVRRDGPLTTVGAGAQHAFGEGLTPASP